MIGSWEVCRWTQSGMNEMLEKAEYGGTCEIFIRVLSDLRRLSNLTIYTKPSSPFQVLRLQPHGKQSIGDIEAEPLNINLEVHWGVYFYLVFNLGFQSLALFYPIPLFWLWVWSHNVEVAGYSGRYRRWQTVLSRNGENLFKYQSRGARSERDC